MTDEPIPRPGSVTLVTGASSGIGAAIAEALIGVGCRAICSGRRMERLEPLVERLGDRALALRLDVTDPDSVESIYERLPGDWREIDILVNNAGHDIGGRERFDKGEVSDWAGIIDTNVTGMIRVTRKIITDMIERDLGHIVNIGSTAGLKAYATGTIYAGSKFAVHGFSESLRLDYVNTGIRVTEILPGMVQTEFAFTRWPDEPERAERFYSDFGACLTPENIANTVVFAIQQPPHVVISQLVVVPNSQT